ncbi:DoxX-like family protein [Nocardia amikacinitolerans]|uniref:DoxX-like family protein n=1 Tax=Nocardia amikacinitolerans TaxID=756689 RepID=A0A285LVD8_9NOCA|nr:DoxX family protein [Nocardia amikacinitolerans]MCP2299203.1 DoxX-like family protein [Nocardia amikacinitolerans]SNY88899.1 DoxX-like family protein [Nocardia amikacinitolerans]
MFALYVTLTTLTALAAATGAWMNFVRHPIPVAAAKEVRVPQTWMLPLGSLLAAGALGLVAGFAIPLVGIAAATGLVLYFIGAVIAHLRVADFHLGRVSTALALTVATLAATLAYQIG